MKDKKTRLIEGLGHITGGCASVKFNEDSVCVTIDDSCFANRYTMGNQIIDYSHLIQKAITKVHELDTFDDLGEHIDPFVIKYHPTWILLRKAFGFTKSQIGEITCPAASNITLLEYLKDNYLAIGIDYENMLLDSSNLEEFVSTCFSKENLDEIVQKSDKHTDLIAFFNCAHMKNEIDAGEFDYMNQIPSMKNVGYHLGEDHFPVFTLDDEVYDFRDENAYELFKQELVYLPLYDKKCKAKIKKNRKKHNFK